MDTIQLTSDDSDDEDVPVVTGFHLWNDSACL